MRKKIKIIKLKITNMGVHLMHGGFVISVAKFGNPLLTIELIIKVNSVIVKKTKITKNKLGIKLEDLSLIIPVAIFL